VTHKPAPAVHVTFLNRFDIEQIGLSDKAILSAVEESLVLQGSGEAVIGARTHLHPKADVEGHFNVLRGWLGGPVGQAGVKVVGDFYHNYEENRPSEYGVLTLFDPRTGAPRAILDASGITDMRTGAVTALGAKHLARKGSKILGHVGARGSSYWNVRLLDRFFDFDEIRVHSRRKESREAFGARLEADLGKPVRIAENWKDCVAGADIVVEATRLLEPEPLLRTEWISKGALVIPYGTNSALEDGILHIIDKVVVDDWGQARVGPHGALRKQVDSGALSEDTLHAELGMIAAGHKPGRQSEEETILFWHRGMSLSDVALGNALLVEARTLNLGHQLRFC